MAEVSPSGYSSVTQEVPKWRKWPATLWSPGPKKKPRGVWGGMEVKWPLDRASKWRGGKDSWEFIAEGPRGLCVSCLFLLLYPHSTASTAGDLGRGLARFQALLLELSFELRTQERQEEPGRQRVGVSGRKKRRERRRKESKSREGAGETSGKCQDLSIWKRDRGAIFRLPWLAIICVRGEKENVKLVSFWGVNEL